jgi:hypothetical protein
MNARPKAVLLAGTLIAQLLLAPAARAADRPIVWFPVGPGSEGSVFTRATTNDPFELHTRGATALHFSRISVQPGGTTGLAPRPGVTVTSIVEGVATVLSAEGTACARRNLNPGSAIIETDGAGTEIRNDGPTPLGLYTVAFTPAGSAPAPLAAGPCTTTVAQHATAETLGRAVVAEPLAVESKGLSDVYIGAARFAPHGTIGWHVQHRPLFAAVDEGSVTLDLAGADSCRTGVFPAGAGFLEPAQTVHAVTNDSGGPARFYYVVFAATPQPFLAPSPAPGQCGRS